MTVSQLTLYNAPSSVRSAILVETKTNEAQAP